METVSARVCVWPRNVLARWNLELHQAAEGRSLKYSHRSRHPSWLMQHLMRFTWCTAEGCCLRDVAAQSAGTAH